MNKEKLTKALSAIAKEEARVRKILLSKSYENVKDITVLLELIQGEPVYSLDLYDEDLNNVTVRVPFDDMKFALTTEDWRRIMEEFDEDLHHHILQKMVFAQISDTQDIAEHCGDKEILAEIDEFINREDGVEYDEILEVLTNWRQHLKEKYGND